MLDCSFISTIQSAKSHVPFPVPTFDLEKSSMQVIKIVMKSEPSGTSHYQNTTI